MNWKGVAIAGGVAVIAAVIAMISLSSNDLDSLPKESQQIRQPVVPLDKIRDGGPPKDGIPSIDEPKFLSANEARFLSDSDVIVGLDINGETKAYPLLILVWHEIVNDDVGGTPVAVTYCPLCYTSQVFERTLDGQTVEFGTSGKLYNSNLVMYDRLTDSYWSQALGQAIVGKHSGDRLEKIPFDLMSWKDWKALHPDTVILSTETGFARPYGADPYGNYYTEDRIIFPVENQDDRMHPKEIIVGLEQNNIYKAYRQVDIENLKVINDKIDEKQILLVSMFDGNVRVFDRKINDKDLDFTERNGKLIDLQTSSEWSYDGVAVAGAMKGAELNRLPIEPGFWFEWVAFHPDTLVYLT